MNNKSLKIYDSQVFSVQKKTKYGVYWTYQVPAGICKYKKGAAIPERFKEYEKQINEYMEDNPKKRTIFLQIVVESRAMQLLEKVLKK